MSSEQPNIEQNPLTNSDNNENATSEKREELKCAVCEKYGNKRCGKCRKIFYCSAECQREHWSTHKLVCQPVVTEDVFNKPSSDNTNQKPPQQPPTQQEEQQKPSQVPEQTQPQPQNTPTKPSQHVRISLKRLLNREMYTVTVELSVTVAALKNHMCAKLNSPPLLTRLWLEFKGQGTFANIVDGYGLLDRLELTLGEAGVVGAQTVLWDEQDENGIWQRDKPFTEPQRHSQLLAGLRDDDDDDDDDEDFPGMGRGLPMGGMGMRGMDMQQMMELMRRDPRYMNMIMQNPGMLSQMQNPRQKSMQEREEEELQKVLAMSLEEEQKRIAEQKKKEEEKKKIEAEQEQIRKFYETSQAPEPNKLKQSVHDDFDELEHEDFNNEDEEEEFLDEEEEEEEK